MPTYDYQYDPATGEAYLVSGDARSLYEGDVSDLLNGKYTLVGTTLRESSTGRIVDNFGAGPINISRYTDRGGNVVATVTGTIKAETLNAPGPRLAEYSISGDVTVLDHLGNERLVSVDASSITGFGQRLLVYQGEQGPQHYEAVTQGDEREAYIRDIYGDTARWASAREMTDAALIGYIGRNEDALVREIQRAGGIENEFGNLETTGSGIVRALASVARGTLTYNKTVYLNREGNIGSLYGA